MVNRMAVPVLSKKHEIATSRTIVDGVGTSRFPQAASLLILAGIAGLITVSQLGEFCIS
jgi:hypothetical protein